MRAMTDEELKEKYSEYGNFCNNNVCFKRASYISSKGEYLCEKHAKVYGTYYKEPMPPELMDSNNE